MKTVSIIIPSFNRADFIAETLESVINQTSPNWECIIVDDGSTDSSFEIIENFIKRDKRFKLYHRDREPKGACTCRNIGVDKCTGEYLIFLDTDDILAPFCVEQRLDAMTDELDYAVFPMLLFKKEPFDTLKLWNIETDEYHLLRLLKMDPIAQGSGQLWKKQSFIKMGLWNVNLKVWQDIDMQIRAFAFKLKYKVFFNLKPDLFLRTSTPDSISRVGFYSIEKLNSRTEVLKSAIQKINLLNINPLDLKYILSDVCISSIRSRYFKNANEIIELAEKNHILQKSDIQLLNKLKYLFKFRLYNVSYFRLKIDKICNLFVTDSKIGKHSFTI